MPCDCRYCRRCDAHHDQETEYARRSLQAQRALDYQSAAFYDRLRVSRLDAAARCLALCEERSHR